MTFSLMCEPLLGGGGAFTRRHVFKWLLCMGACVHVYVFVQLEMRKVQTILDVLFSFLKWRYESDHTLEIFLYVRSPRVFCNVEILKRCFGFVRNTIICLCKAEVSAAQCGCFFIWGPSSQCPVPQSLFLYRKP